MTLKKAMGSRAQVDIALTIGSIVVPIVVLLGALIFSWAMISTTTNAGRVAGIIAHDMTNLVDLAYSVPDDITLRYVPVSICKFAKEIDPSTTHDFVTCFNGFMNFTSDIGMTVFYKNTEYPVVEHISSKKVGSHYSDDAEGTSERVNDDGADYPFLVMLSSGLYFPEDTISDSIKEMLKDCKDSNLPSSVCDELDKELSDRYSNFPIMFQFSAFADPMDFNLYKYGTVITVDNGVFIEKRREAFSDTMATPELAEDKDPLEQLVTASKDVCSKSSDQTAVMVMKPGFYMKQSESDSGKLCLYKERINPNINDLIEERDRDNPVYYEESEIYCFNFNDIPGGCNYDLSGIATSIMHYPARQLKTGSGDKITDIVKPIGGSIFIININYASGKITYTDNTTQYNRFVYVFDKLYSSHAVDISNYDDLETEIAPAFAEIFWIADMKPDIISDSDLQQMLRSSFTPWSSATMYDAQTLAPYLEDASEELKDSRN